MTDSPRNFTRYGSIYMLVHIPPFNGSIFNTALAPWITSFNVITAGTNIIATGKNRGQFPIGVLN